MLAVPALCCPIVFYVIYSPGIDSNAPHDLERGLLAGAASPADGEDDDVSAPATGEPVTDERVSASAVHMEREGEL